MANPEHLAKLKEGVKAWNEWRKRHEEISPDLSEVNLSVANLRGADLSNANLIGANLEFANLTSANLTGANLIGAKLTGAKLTGADFNGVHFFFTSWGDVDLSVAKGLDSASHGGPSTIGIDTIYKSKGKIPEVFLRGCGVPQELIDYIPSLIGATEPIQFYSVFISYSSKDQAFAERLYADLQAKNVRCWFAPEDLKTGDEFRTRIDEAIRVYDKLLLVLSQNSVGSSWVKKEVETVLERENEQKRTMLFPIRLDDTVMEIKTGWAADVRRARHIGDFTQWKDHDSYQKAFNRLMRDLKADERRGA